MQSMSTVQEITSLEFVFGERARARREVLERSREAVANRAGISVRTLARCENGEGDPSLATAQKIAEALETTLPELLAS